MAENMIQTFIDKAGLVSARVYQVSSLAAALEKTVELCQAKDDLDPQMDSKIEPGKGDEPNRIMAAPNLDESDFAALAEACEAAQGITLVRDGMRQYPGGIDLGVTQMDFGIAETGTLVLNSNSEETRLATMLSEIHVAILDISKIRATALGMADELKELVGNTGDYLAFITGASRTADIERVLAIGVHGPLELVILLVED